MNRETFLASVEQLFNSMSNEKFDNLKYPWQVTSATQCNVVYRDGLSFEKDGYVVNVSGIYGDQEIDVKEYIELGNYRPCKFEALPSEVSANLLRAAQKVILSV